MKTLRLLLAASLAVQSFPAVAFAQESTGLDEVLVTGSRGYRATRGVTATKTDTPLKDIPAAVQVLPQQLMEDQGATNLADVVKTIAGATQSGSSNYGFFNNFLIRGLNSTFLRDGVPDGFMTNGYARTLTDVERVEVLRGPGSALYGSGAPGGTINLVSKRPTDRFSAGIAQTLGSFDETKTQAFASGPFGEYLRFRIDAAHEEASGFRGIGYKTDELLPRLEIRPAAGHLVYLDFDWRDMSRVADPYGIPFAGTVLLDVDRENRYYTPFANTDQEVNRYAAGYSYKPGDELEVRFNTVVLDRTLHLLRNAGGTIAAGGVAMTGRQLRSQSDRITELVTQLESVYKKSVAGMEHTLLAGLEYRYDRGDALRETANLPNIANVYNPVVTDTMNGLAWTLNFDRRLDSPQYGAYLQDQIALSEQWKIRGGARFDRIGLWDRNKRTNVTSKRTDDRVSWQGGLVYQPLRVLSLYGGASRSNQSNFSTESATIGPPERATQFELGAKTELFDGALFADAAVYEVTRQDFLVTINGNPVPVGKQRTKGAELVLTARPVPGWETAANVSFQKGKLLNVPNTPAAQGKNPTGTPPYTAAIWSSYELQHGSLRGLGFGAGASARGDVYQDNENTKPIDGYVTGDLGAFYRRAGWELRVNVINVADASWFRNGSNNGAFPGDARTFRGTVSWRY